MLLLGLGWGLSTQGGAHAPGPQPATQNPVSDGQAGSGGTQGLGGPVMLPAAQVPVPTPEGLVQVPLLLLCPQDTGVSNEGAGAPPTL